jgi:hypothetical protein
MATLFRHPLNRTEWEATGSGSATPCSRLREQRVGDSVSVALELMTPWPEPKVPADLAEALASDPQAGRFWMDITPVARWDWIRWIGSTRNRDTRAIRIDVLFASPFP